MGKTEEIPWLSRGKYGCSGCESFSIIAIDPVMPTARCLAKLDTPLFNYKHKDKPDWCPKIKMEVKEEFHCKCSNCGLEWSLHMSFGSREYRDKFLRHSERNKDGIIVVMVCTNCRNIIIKDKYTLTEEQVSELFLEFSRARKSIENIGEILKKIIKIKPTITDRVEETID